MELSRRDFLKASGAGMGGVFLFSAMTPAAVSAREHLTLPLKKNPFSEKTTICPYDGSGCGFMVAAENGKVVNIEGDPEHPVNVGAACSKGAGMRQLAADNPRRLSKVLYRAPGSDKWDEKSWDWALDEMAKRIKKTRDENFIEKDSAGNTVNRLEAIANLGGSALDNEECYLLAKFTRALGVVYLEHHARI